MAIFTGALVKGMIGGAIKERASKMGKSKVGKLLGREKRVMMGQPHPKAEVGGIKPQQSLAPDAPDVGVGPTPITPVDGEGGKSFSTDKEAALQIKRSTIEVATLLKGSYVLDKERQKDKRKEEEQEKRGKAEKGLEKPKGGAGKLKIKIPGKGILDKMFGFLGQILLFGITMKLLEWGPKLMPILKGLAVAADWIIEAGIWIVDALAGVIDFGYKLVEKMEGWVKNVFGEEGAKKFTTFMTNLKNLFTGFLLWKIIGKKIFTAVIRNIKFAFGIVKSVAVNAFRFINFLSGGMIGKGFQALGQGIGKLAGNVAGRFMGTGAGKGIGSVFKHGAKKGAKRLLLKMFGKTFVKTASKIFGRVPIVGPLIVGLVSLVSGEPIGKALFKTFGAALGGFLGTIAGPAISVAVAGLTAGIGALLTPIIMPASVMIGEILGTFVGDMLYGLIFEGGLAAVGKKLKDAFVAIGQKIGEAVNFVKDFVVGGFSRFWEGIPKVKIPDLPKDPPKWIPRWVPMKRRIWNVFRFGAKLLLGPLSLLMGKELPNLFWLMLPTNTIPLLMKSFFPPGGASESAPANPLGDSASGEGGDPSMTGPSEAELKEEERLEREKRRKEMMEAVKKKLNQAKEFAGKVLQKANPLNWFKKKKEEKKGDMWDVAFQKVLPKNFLISTYSQEEYDKLAADYNKKATSGKAGILNAYLRRADKKGMEIDVDKQRRKRRLEAANQQGGAQGVIDSISTTASYEDSEIEVIPLPAPVVGGGGGGADTQMPQKSQSGGSTTFTNSGADSKGSYEILYKGS